MSFSCNSSHRDGFLTTRLTNNDVDNDYCSLFNGKIAWTQWDDSGNSGPEGFSIFYWDGNFAQQIANNGSRNDFPSLYNETIAWQSQGEIFFWDGHETTIISDSSTYDSRPSLYNGTIAWNGCDNFAGNYEIYYWDGKSITQLTDNDSEFFDYSPTLQKGRIAWTGYTNLENSHIYFWDGESITKVSVNSTRNWGPSFHGRTIAWSGHDGNDQEIYLAEIFDENCISDFDWDLDIDGSDLTAFMIRQLNESDLEAFSGVFGKVDCLE